MTRHQISHDARSFHEMAVQDASRGGSWLRTATRMAVLVLLWQTSHVGEPLNEWADVACDTFGLEDDYPIPRGSVKFASMTFPSHRGAAQEYAMQGMRRVVAARLRSRVSGTVLRDDTEHVHLLGVTAETQQLCDEIAARRARPSAARATR